MDERYLLREMAKCKDEIKELKAEINGLEDRLLYLKELYYQLEEDNNYRPTYLKNLDNKICTDGFIIGIKF